MVEKVETNKKDTLVTLDVIIPFYNEEEVVDTLFKRLESVFSAEAMVSDNLKSVRYLLIDDGSKDKTAQIICEYIKKGLPAKLYRLSRNFGHQNAISAGLEFSEADLVVILDADLQDPPELISEMLELWREGYDIVYAQRKRRKENPVKVLLYWIFYRFLNFLSDIEVPMDSGDFSLMDRRVVEIINALPEKLRFPRGLRAWVGFKQKALRYDRPAREFGSSKYTLRNLYTLATDGLASLSIKPLRVAQFFSISFSLSAAFLALFIFFIPYDISLEFLIMYLLILVSGFVQTLCIYVLGSYVGRSYLEIKGRPSYIVQEIVSEDNFTTKSGDKSK